MGWPIGFANLVVVRYGLDNAIVQAVRLQVRVGQSEKQYLPKLGFFLLKHPFFILHSRLAERTCQLSWLACCVAGMVWPMQLAACPACAHPIPEH